MFYVNRLIKSIVLVKSKQMHLPTTPKWNQSIQRMALQLSIYVIHIDETMKKKYYESYFYYDGMLIKKLA